MALPLPKALYDIQPGGGIATAFNALTQNALYNTRKELENKYYGPNIESEMAQRNALTKQYEIANQFSPERLSLANEHQRQVNKYYEDQIKAAIRQKETTAAMNEFKQKNPLLFAPGVSGQIGAQIFLKDHPELNNQQPNNIGTTQQPNNIQQLPPVSLPTSQSNIPYDQQIRDSIAQSNASRQARANLDISRTEGYPWSQLTAETRNGMTAQGLGMNVSPTKMRDYVNKKMDIRQIAEAEGLDADNLPPPIYFPTQATKTRTQQVQQVTAELDYLSSASTAILKRYADTFFGISGARLKDMFSSDPEAQDRFGEYNGALSVQTGIATGRVLAEGGKSGVEVMKMVKDSALKGIDQNAPIRMTGRAFEKSQKTIDKLLQKGASIRTTIGMSPFSGNKKNIENVSENKNIDITKLSDDELRRILNE